MQPATRMARLDSPQG